MENEKILSNEELLDITAGFSAVEKISINPINRPTVKYGIFPYPGNIPVLKYGIGPIQSLYSVRPKYIDK